MKSFLFLFAFLTTQSIRADLFVNLGLQTPNIGTIVCFNTDSLKVYLLKDHSIFNKDRKTLPHWPEVKSGPGEYILENAQVVYFTPGKPQFQIKNGQLNMTMSLLNDGMVEKKFFVSVPPWDGSSGATNKLYFRLIGKAYQLNCVGM